MSSNGVQLVRVNIRTVLYLFIFNRSIQYGSLFLTITVLLLFYCVCLCVFVVFVSVYYCVTVEEKWMTLINVSLLVEIPLDFLTLFKLVYFCCTLHTYLYMLCIVDCILYPCTPI